jgi:prevent-host-death family protein
VISVGVRMICSSDSVNSVLRRNSRGADLSATMNFRRPPERPHSSAAVCYACSMDWPEQEIPQRELRNDIANVLKRVARGQRLRVTVRGRPVADLIPVSAARRFVPRSEFGAILLEDPLDRRFQDDVRAALGGTVDEL